MDEHSAVFDQIFIDLHNPCVLSYFHAFIESRRDVDVSVKDFVFDAGLENRAFWG
jgi:hypothetical protein